MIHMRGGNDKLYIAHMLPISTHNFSAFLQGDRPFRDISPHLRYVLFARGWRIRYIGFRIPDKLRRRTPRSRWKIQINFLVDNAFLLKRKKKLWGTCIFTQYDPVSGCSSDQINRYNLVYLFKSPPVRTTRWLTILDSGLNTNRSKDPISCPSAATTVTFF